MIMKNKNLTFQEWKQTEDGKRAAADAEHMTKAEKIAEIITIMMRIAGEPETAIQAMREKCLREDSTQTATNNGIEKGGADHA